MRIKKGLADIRKYNGQPQGMFGGDEGLHGNNPTQGSELCSAVELMYSLEKMMEITGDLTSLIIWSASLSMRFPHRLRMIL